MQAIARHYHDYFFFTREGEVFKCSHWPQVDGGALEKEYMDDGFYVYNYSNDAVITPLEGELEELDDEGNPVIATIERVYPAEEGKNNDTTEK